MRLLFPVSSDSIISSPFTPYKLEFFMSEKYSDSCSITPGGSLQYVIGLSIRLIVICFSSACHIPVYGLQLSNPLKLPLLWNVSWIPVNRTGTLGVSLITNTFTYHGPIRDDGSFPAGASTPRPVCRVSVDSDVFPSL